MEDGQDNGMNEIDDGQDNGLDGMEDGQDARERKEGRTLFAIRYSPFAAESFSLR